MRRTVQFAVALCLTAIAWAFPWSTWTMAQGTATNDKPLVLTVPGIPPIFASTRLVDHSVWTDAVALIAMDGM